MKDSRTLIRPLAAVLIMVGIVAALALVSKHGPLSVAPSEPSLPAAANWIDGTAGSGLDLTSLGSLINQSLDRAATQPVSGETRIGITSHHLPTAAPVIAEFYKTFQAAPGPRDTFIIMGPDHYLHCQAPLSTTRRSYRTPFGELTVNLDIVGQLLQHEIKIDDACFDGEHSMAVEAVFIKKLFPDATIVPLLFAPTVPPDMLESVQKVLVSYSNIAVVVSVDFNHYQPVAVANKSDEEAAHYIEQMQGEKITAQHLDSPAAVRLALALARAWNETRPYIFRRANSYEFTGNPENTTGYMDVVFLK